MIESETVRRTIEIREKKRQTKEEKGKERKKKKTKENDEATVMPI